MVYANVSSLLSFFSMGVNNGNRKEVFAIGSIDVAAVSVGLLLKIILRFKKHRTL